MTGNTPIRQLSPLRNTTSADTPEALASEQLAHFGIDENTAYGEALKDFTARLYSLNLDAHTLWARTMETIGDLDRSDRIAYFNAKRFLCFQLAKILDTLQNPMRATYQSLVTHDAGFAAKGPYPIFDNVTALFAASPVITRTATYIYACTEWVEDAFTGREFLHEIYSRLMNPTSIALANHVVDLECGPESAEYLAWNYNSGMAAIDGLLSHLVGYEDVILASRNVYGGTYQLLHDWFGKESNLNVAVEWFDGFDEAAFKKALEAAEAKHADRLARGRKIYVYIESPCNPHGNVLDVPAMSRLAHEHGWTVVCDATVGTPFLSPLLRNPSKIERPDYIIHSYTKEMTGGGATTAGVVIGRGERMFMPKGESMTLTNWKGEEEELTWDHTMFWNVYYIKGAFLDADKAYEVLSGLKTYEMRVIAKAINTITLTKALHAHPRINVNSPALEDHPNHAQLKEHLYLELPAGLFTIDFEKKGDQPALEPDIFKRFFDSLEPAIGLQVSLGQTNTLALCPGLTSHSEMSREAQAEAGISPTTIRISVGLEDPRRLLAHMEEAARSVIDPVSPGFSDGFMDGAEIDRIYRETYAEVHRRFIEAQPAFSALTA
ncbi:trans-sulfuration enzyme family protein [Parvularcula marina]|uniref:Cys/Met metabolism pyridoxal-phosphate-dependent enzyme n=1 Tax=Parvularcula marina TaxID=2292771 RepID=A0A371R890_9PROT|nr:PLP-dependent transferase [Parvularcula marina]RFB01662.1 Cys/Met metabolism pyridoxal-phosphate-dependent enzyme [Parvularcula marina]